ncbi:MAG: glycosyltransferase family 4 protein [Brevefilum sp.]
MNNPTKTAFVHYSAPPTIGGVESVISAHAKIFQKNGYPVIVIAGRGRPSALTEGVEFKKIRQLDSQQKTVLEVNRELAEGVVSKSYEALREKIKHQLERSLANVENVIIHNIFSKNLNLAATEAMVLLQKEGKIPNCIAWCHDFSFASQNDKKTLHEGFPWDFLQIYNPEIKYVVVSCQRQEILSGIFKIPKEKIEVIYNGFDPDELLGLSNETGRLVSDLELLEADLIVLMPVRITKAKNIEFAMHVTAELKSKECHPMVILTGPPDPHDPDNMTFFRNLKKLRKDLRLEKNFKFLFDENPESGEPNYLDMNSVADLYRVCDMVFMPSHHEGFGMPVLEAGFLGKPVFSTRIPASVEIGGKNIHMISASFDAKDTAQQILDWASKNEIHLFRLKTRQNYVWQKIFNNQIRPLLVDN